jgi:S-formylglutathione hydrolase FrmB
MKILVRHLNGALRRLDIKRVSVLIFLLALSIICFPQQSRKGKILEQKILSKSIEGNPGGEDPSRSVTIYLPPGYEADGQRYPVIYFLHGFGADDKRVISETHINDLMDTAIVLGLIRPTIIIMPSSRTHFRGSFYTNSTLMGKWTDFIARDLVDYVDKNFRTIPNRNSRGLVGHSMGGHGALKVGMLNPDVFGSVYAMSPAVLNWAEEMNLNNPAFKKISAAREEAEVNNQFMNLVMISLGRAFSPNQQKPPFFADFPATYVGDSIKINTDVVRLWEANFPINMINDHLAALKSFNALKIDWGRNDEFDHIPVTCLQFSKRLEAYGVKHMAEEFNGTHGDRFSGMEGRIYTEMIPFFAGSLAYERANDVTRPRKGTIKKK